MLYANPKVVIKVNCKLLLLFVSRAKTLSFIVGQTNKSCPISIKFVFAQCEVEGIKTLNDNEFS